MAFMRNFDTIIVKSNMNISKINSDNGLTLYNYDSNFNLQYSKTILSKELLFLDYWFDIDEKDNIYGLVHDKENFLIYYNINDNYIVKNKLLKYDSNKNFIKFVYIKKINNSTNIFYYSLDKLNPNNLLLMHRYNQNNKWYTFIIDSFSYNVLTNYVVVFDKYSFPTIFYFKLYEGFEELFVSSFDSNIMSWSDPIQLTNSKKPKIYLSAIYDSNDKYHIVFSENNSNKYYCIYIHGYIENSHFHMIHNWILCDTVACTFPTIIEYNSIIYAEWIEYHNLYLMYSQNYGHTWSHNSIAQDSSSLPFSCCSYHSNAPSNDTFNYYTLYIFKNTLKILGL